MESFVHHPDTASPSPSLKARRKTCTGSTRIRDRFQRSESVDKIIHDVSWVSSLTCSITAYPIFFPLLLLLLLLVQRQARFHRDERRSTRFESGCDTAESLALAALLLILSRAEERLVPGGVCGERCAAVGFDDKDVWLESERVYELGWTICC
jgi:hypothetical protein